jgi:hypothetical protein
MFRNECTRSTPLDPKLKFLKVSYYFGAFRTVWLLTKLGAKRAELVQKFVTQSRVEIFHNEGTRSTPLDLKLMFWRILYYLGAFGTICLPYETRCKMGRTSAKSLFPRSRVKIFHNECTRSTPLHTKTHVLARFEQFGSILNNLVCLRNSVQNGPN